MMKSFFDYLIHRPLFWIIAFGLAVPSFYLQDSLWAEEHCCKHPPVPPHESADGTVDHVLIRKPMGFKGFYVILRFNKDDKINTSENTAPIEVGIVNGPSVALSSATISYVTAYYNVRENWRPVSRSEFEKLNRQDVAWIMFSSSDDSYTSTSLESYLKEAETACEPPKKHTNGLLEYRLKDGRDPASTPACFHSFIPDQVNPRSYVVERPAAILHCSSPWPNGLLGGQCNGSIDTPQKVHVNIRFYSERDITSEQVVAAITHATQEVGHAFVEFGELGVDEVFSFSDKRGNDQ